MSLFSTNQNVTTSTTIDPEEPYTLAQHLGWNANDILLVIILPIVLALLFCLSIRHCYVSNRRHAEFHERRQNLRALERAQIRENKKNKEKKRKERLKDIEKALVTKTASKCKCSKEWKAFGSMLDLTVHTTMSDDNISLSSSVSHDIENAAANDVQIIANDCAVDDETVSAQTCAICLEPYIGGKDKIAWSKYQTCQHAFHHKCIVGWLAEIKKNKDGNCPCCRGPYLKERVDSTNEKAQVLGEVGGSDDEEITEDNANDNAVSDTGDEGSTRVDEELHDNTNNDVQTTDEEANFDVEANDRQRKDEESSIDCDKAANVRPTDETRNCGGSLEFISFCVNCGLKRKVSDNAISIKPIYEPTALDNV